MRYRTDHDFHIHSQLSSCSGDPAQTSEYLLSMAEKHGFDKICLTDHFWDEAIPGASSWYAPQNYAHICQAKPLPQSDKVRFYFGCETDMDKFFTIGISPKRLAEMDFIIIPTTHLHMRGFTLDEKDDSLPCRARLFVERFDKLLDMDLPFEKIGLAHITCSLMAKPLEPGKWRHLDLLDMISDAELERLFTRAAQKKMGIELNFPPEAYTEQDLERLLRPYRLAKKCGCKFYFGSDAHHPAGVEGAKARFEHIVDLLDLQEEDKFSFAFLK